MLSYFQQLEEYQENIMKEKQYHKVSDVSDTAANNEESGLKTPTKMVII
jgi:hypothetical protein